MGLERFVKHMLIPGSITVDMVKNMADEGSIIEGYKKTMRQELTEDNPITSQIYQYGKSDGKTVGYAEASDVYEKKLIDQADMFLEQKKIYEDERDKYVELLDEYEQEIESLENKVNKTEAEKEYLSELLLRERKLRGLA